MFRPQYKEARREEDFYDRGKEECNIQSSIVGEEGVLTGECSEEAVHMIRRKGDEKEEIVRKEKLPKMGVPRAQDRPPEVGSSSSHPREDGGFIIISSSKK